MRAIAISLCALLPLAFVATGCPKGEEGKPAEEGKATDEGKAGEEAAPALKTDKGVDAAKKVISIGTLDDESGPAATIGKPFALGKRVLAAQINAGGSGLLPDGWKVELISKDHGYNPQKAVQAYNEIKDKILFLGTSFGTPPTLPLRPLLKRDDVLAFPASLSSELANDETTIPVGVGYKFEAMRALDWVVKSAEDKAAIKPCIVSQKDDYGKDGKAGWEASAKHHGLTIASEQTVASGQKDMASVVTGLSEAGCTHVMLTVLPSGTGPILGTAAQLQFMPTWIGNTPAWIDRFFDPKVIPPAVFAKFYWVTGFPFWGEDVPYMKDFIAAWEKYGKADGGPDFYILVSYAQGLAQIEAARRAIEAGDITRAGYKKEVKSLKDFNAKGLIQPIDLTKFPYRTSTKTRVLTPDFGKKSWTVTADWADPEGM